MSDTNQNQSKNTFLIVLTLLLLIFISVQGWYMYKIKSQLDELQQQPEDDSALSNKRPVEENITAIDGTDEAIVEMQTPVTENYEAQTKPPLDENLSSDNNQSTNYNDPDDSTFGGQAWNPYKEMERMQRDMDRIFNRRFDHRNNHPGFNRPNYNNPYFTNPAPDHHGFQYHFSRNFSTPEIDVKENAQQYIVLVNLPGAKENDISVTLNGQRLSIKGKQDYKKQDKNATGNVIFQERHSGKFQRSITLSRPVDQNKMKTHLDNGVLTVIIPKLQNARMR